VIAQRAIIRGTLDDGLDVEEEAGFAVLNKLDSTAALNDE
jgi:hypothetical protein